MTPKFSVVIPTFNRARLLPFAVQSVLGQSCDDFEIVISNGGATDDTADVVRGLGDSRIKYVESSTTLTIAENYLQGLTHTSGEYVTFLSDDDAYTPRLLETVLSTIERTGADMVGYQYCRYYHDRLYEFDRDIPASSLLIPKYSNAEYAFSGSLARQEMLKANGLINQPHDARFIVPFLSNCTYHSSIFERIRERRANPFDFVPPDMYLAFAVFYFSGKYVCLDAPLLVWSSWKGNATSSASRDQSDSLRKMREQMSERKIRFSPLKLITSFNLSAEAALTAQDDFGDGSFTPDWDHYFFSAWENLEYLRSKGIDVRSEKAVFEEALQQQDGKVINYVKDYRNKLRFRLKSMLNNRVPVLAGKLRQLKSLASRSQTVHIKTGGARDFANVNDAARHVFEW